MRAQGEGSVYQRKSDGRWLYSRTLPSGKRQTVSAATRAAVLRRKDELDAPLRESRPVPDKTLTVAGLFTLWLESQADNLAPNTLRLYQDFSAHHILPQLGKTKVVALTLPDVERWLSSLSRPTASRAALAPATRSRIRQMLVSALNYAVRCRVLTYNVAHDAKVKVERTESAYLTTDEQVTLLQAAAGDRLCALWTLLVGTGLRRGEAMGLTRSALDLGAGTVTVRQSLTRVGNVGAIRQPKTAGSTRVVPLPPFVVRALTEHLRRSPVLGDGLLFRSEVGTPLDPTNVGRDFRRLCERAGLGFRHCHECRHGYAVTLLEAGTPLEIVAANLGHSTIRETADRYGKHSRPVAQAAAMAALDAALGSNF
jgi:integrase